MAPHNPQPRQYRGLVTVRMLSFQVKRAVDPVPSDAEGQSVIAECIAAFEADADGIRHRHHLFGLAARAHAGHLGEVAELTRRARAHDDADSFTTLITAGSGAPEFTAHEWRNARLHTCDTMSAKAAVPSPEIEEHRVVGAV